MHRIAADATARRRPVSTQQRREREEKAEKAKISATGNPSAEIDNAGCVKLK